MLHVLIFYYDWLKLLVHLKRICLLYLIYLDIDLMHVINEIWPRKWYFRAWFYIKAFCVFINFYHLLCSIMNIDRELITWIGINFCELKQTTMIMLLYLNFNISKVFMMLPFSRPTRINPLFEPNREHLPQWLIKSEWLTDTFDIIQVLQFISQVDHFSLLHNKIFR